MRRSVGGTGEFFSQLTADLAFVTYCRARYLTPDKNGQTRAEYNAAFYRDEPEKDPTPDWDIPPEGQYLYDWYIDIENGINRIVGGAVKRITWQDFVAWRSVTRNLVRPYEFAILRAMDLACCEALEGELQRARATAEDEAKREAETQRRAGLTSRGRK